MHTPDRPRVPCDQPGCDKDFADDDTLRVHKKSSHEGIVYTCSYCPKTFTFPGNRDKHVLGVHDGVKFPCPMEGCDKEFTQKGNIQEHVARVHLGVLYPCLINGCDRTFNNRSNMKEHIKAVHMGIKNFVCTDPECDEVFSQRVNMERHYEVHHTVDGQQRKIKKQSRLHKLLESVYRVKAEKFVQYRSGMVSKPDKFHAFVDFHILDIERAIALVELDEHGHKSYPLPCELTRMEQIHEYFMQAQRAAAEQLPIVFVRLNPDTQKVDGQTVYGTLKAREELLMRTLDRLAKGEIALTSPAMLNIIYLNYDMSDGKPAILDHPQYSEQMKACVLDIGTGAAAAAAAASDMNETP